jgi:hypothetical protein
MADDSRPDACRLFFSMGTARIPLVEITNHTDGYGVRSPYTENYWVIFSFTAVSTQKIISTGIVPLMKKINRNIIAFHVLPPYRLSFHYPNLL